MIHNKPTTTMFINSLFYTYSNLILHSALSLTITLILTLLNIPVRFLEGLHTYIQPENLNNNNNNTQSGVRAAIRRPGTTESEEPKKRNHKSKDKFEFDENHAQIFRLQLTNDHLRSRICFTEYRDVFNYLFIAISSIVLHSFLNVSEGSGILINGSIFPILLVFIAVSKVVFTIFRVSFEKSASKRSEKQLSVLLGFLWFSLALVIIFVISPNVLDFEFDSVDGVGKIWIAIFAGLLSGFLFIPGVKSARSFWLGTDQLHWNLSIIPCGWFGRMLLYANVLLTVFSSLLWINPLVEDFINTKNVGTRNRVNDKFVGNFGLERPDFVMFRFWCLMGSGVLQIITLRPNLQMFLNEAVLSWYQRLHASKVPDLDFSRAKIFLHNYYLCLVVLQFLIPPALVLLFLGLSKVEGNLLDTFPFICSFVPCSAFVKEVALFMSWWIAFVWSIFTLSTLVVYRCGLLYVS
ncbi:hypothetical protein IFM89_037379 [Coptis chinensis]|uniref:Transmembrane protein n=1 Tax=Coptis chinensis TaxID=261450 RepID=A0A835IJL0_9MAGN|nr:hypothetical protein IFM89_037379 [Coptis chinensis]